MQPNLRHLDELSHEKIEWVEIDQRLCLKYVLLVAKIILFVCYDCE